MTEFPLLSFRGISRTFPGPPSVEALKPFNLDLSSGDYITVAGPSGSGKTTFLSIAGLLDRPSGGRLLLNGLETTELSEADRTAVRGTHLGFVFQQFHLMARRTVLDNVLLSGIYRGIGKRAADSQATDLIERVGLSGRAEALAGQLSGGEMQRVAIARSLMGSPMLLLCDEPTGNLDSANGAMIMEVLSQLHADGLTLVVITHDEGIASSGHRRIIVRDGRLRETT